tara:strand:- start:273 stop:434 length:162 start_codon:yes stop_codon:yes gene_type:complete
VNNQEHLAVPSKAVSLRAEQISEEQYQRFLRNWAQQLFAIQFERKRLGVKKAA